MNTVVLCHNLRLELIFLDRKLRQCSSTPIYWLFYVKHQISQQIIYPRFSCHFPDLVRIVLTLSDHPIMLIICYLQVFVSSPIEVCYILHTWAVIHSYPSTIISTVHLGIWFEPLFTTLYCSIVHSRQGHLQHAFQTANNV